MQREAQQVKPLLGWPVSHVEVPVYALHAVYFQTNVAVKYSLNTECWTFNLGLDLQPHDMMDV